MVFLGIDFGWQGKPSGVASLTWTNRRLKLGSLDRLTGLPSILAWIDREAAGAPAMVAVDAPIVINNVSGMRDADRLMHCHFGKYHAGCYPANLSLPHAARPVELGRALEVLGFRHAPEIEARRSGRYQIEVHPHAAAVSLFRLPRILKYKKGRLAARRPELERYRSLLLTELPLLDAPELPTIRQTGAEMKHLEDRLDALLCAYIGAHWWLYGLARNLVCGSREGGYIVVPKRAAGETGKMES